MTVDASFAIHIQF